PAAILFDWDSWWASEQDSHPSDRLRYKQEALDWYSAFLALGIRADVVPSATDLAGYGLVVAPILHTVPAALKARLEEYVGNGGHLVASYFSGITDENDHIWLGGYPGALADLLGVRIDEFGPLLDGDEVSLDNGTTATLWADRVLPRADGVEVLTRYTTGEHAGDAAVTRNTVGSGSAAYVGARLGTAGLEPVLADLAARAGITSELPAELRGAVEQVLRTDDDADYVFLINRTDEPVDITGVDGDILTGEESKLAPRSVAVLTRKVSRTT
ncbi:beta-galactosidase, partial [Arthrobacter agilis]